jgi:hypothetical protein
MDSKRAKPSKYSVAITNALCVWNVSITSLFCSKLLILGTAKGWILRIGELIPSPDRNQGNHEELISFLKHFVHTVSEFYGPPIVRKKTVACRAK